MPLEFLSLTNAPVLHPILELTAGGFLTFKDWDNLRKTCKTLKRACDEKTTYEATIENDGNGTTIIPLFKWGMASKSDHRLYISLPNGGHNNVSRSFKWKGNTTGETLWYKIRFCPKRMMVHCGDYTFSKPGSDNTKRDRRRADWEAGFNVRVPDLGDLSPEQIVNVGEKTPYGTCFDCSAPNSDRARSRIDLRGTPFAVASRFVNAGYAAKGSWNYHHDDQSVDLTGGGYCGMTVSSDFSGHFDDHPGTWSLRLKLLQS